MRGRVQARCAALCGVAAALLWAGLARGGQSGASAPAGGVGSGAAAPPAASGKSQLEIVRSLLARGAFAEAEAPARAAVSAQPDDLRAVFYLGIVLHKSKRYGEALPLLERASSAPAGAFPEAPHACHYLGWCRYYLGDIPGAEAAFLQHAKSFPEYDDTQFALGLVAFDQDRLPEAEGRFSQALLLLERDGGRPRDRAKNLSRLGDVRLRLGRLDEAERNYRAATELQPDLAEHWSKLARVLDRLNKPTEAASARARAAAIEAMPATPAAPAGPSAPPAASPTTPSTSPPQGPRP